MGIQKVKRVDDELLSYHCRITLANRAAQFSAGS